MFTVNINRIVNFNVKIETSAIQNSRRLLIVKVNEFTQILA